MKYRPEIDGLRSLAILPVIFYHAGFSWVSGGFIGVDVFFVISGYLITGIIASELRAGEFSIVNFYERRIRRIFPALLTVVASTMAAGSFFALPSQLEILSASSITAMLSISNFYFWTLSGYFSPATEFMPLLHTWSLGVEEQFYFLFPLFLILLQRFRIDFRLILTVLLPLAFIVALWLSFNKPSAAFYLLPARAWELGIGAILAVGAVRPIESQLGKEILSTVGVGAIVFGIFWIESTQPFPGYVALLPCLGTALVIHCADGSSLVGRVLSNSVLVFIGLISYSLYLWHWPIFVFLRMYQATIDLSTLAALGGIACCFLISFATWRFIEVPCRRRKSISFLRLGPTLATVSFGLGAISVFGIVSGGWPNRVNPEVKLVSEALSDVDPLRELCSGFRYEGRAGECTFGSEDIPVSYVVLGDSHAGALRPAFDTSSEFANRRGTIWNKGGCPFLVGAIRVPDADAKECDQFRTQVIDELRSAPEIRTVVIVNRWAPMYSGTLPEVGGSYRIEMSDEYTNKISPLETKSVFRRSLRRTLDTLISMNKRVILIHGIPEAGFDVPTILGLSMHNGSSGMKVFVEDFHQQTNVILEGYFLEVAEDDPNVVNVNVRDAFCSSLCRISDGGVPLFYDDDHITASAAMKLVAPVIDIELRKQSVN